jgi:capsular exopolysaccharide synthesis family protein
MTRYLTLVRRHKLLIVAVLLLLSGSAYAFSKQQTRLYQASSEVLLDRQNLGTSLAGLSDSSTFVEPERLVETHARIAEVPAVASRVLDRVGLDDRTPDQLLDRTEVLPSKSIDVLVFQVKDELPRRAEELANAWANTYVNYSADLDVARFSGARKDVENRLARLRAEGEAGTGLYRQLSNRAQQLQTLETLQTGNASVVGTADSAEQVQPKTVRNVVFAAILGLLLGVGLALLRESLDTRVRSADEIGELLKLPLLARLPGRSGSGRKRSHIAMLKETFGAEAESYRMLRTGLQFAGLDRDSRTFMFTSAVEGEGKSTAAANLAVSYAQAGQRVALVDLDLRHPTLDRFFDGSQSPGVTSVILGQASLEEALFSVDLGSPTEANGGTASTGELDVLFAGPLPPDPGDLVQREGLGAVLADLAEGYDVVFIDAPPVLSVGDAISLSTRVDGIVLIVRLGIAKRPMLRELKRVLEGAPARVVGFVLTGAEREASGYGSYFGYGTRYASEPRDELARQSSSS